MFRLDVLAIGCAILAALCPAALASERLTLKAADGVVVHGSFYPASGVARATILLFHQAASNRAEYAETAPRLAKAGYDVIAIDQRSGGPRFGSRNETVEALGRSTDFLEALPDLEAALAEGRRRSPAKPVIVWGSSYSAALVFLLAARHPDEIGAVLAFSPGEYLSGASVAEAARKVSQPVFVASASDDGEISAAREILSASPAAVKTQYVPEAGVHGSSTLRRNSNPEGAEAAWTAVEAFLGGLASP